MKKNISAMNRLDSKTQRILGEMWQEACEKGKNLSFQIASGSMSPLIEVGDVVKVSRAEPSQIRIGDIMAFQDGQNVVVHRLIGKSWSNRQLTLRHMGDASLFSGRIPAQNLIGRVTSIEKGGREIPLGSARPIIANRVLGWRLWLIDALSRRQYWRIGLGLRMLFRPVWRLCRSLLHLVITKL
jgi:signal peptidase I